MEHNPRGIATSFSSNSQAQVTFLIVLTPIELGLPYFFTGKRELMYFSNQVERLHLD
jgi:hypothetical protein